MVFAVILNGSAGVIAVEHNTSFKQQYRGLRQIIYVCAIFI